MLSPRCLPLIKGSFVNDLNIVDIHRQIKENFIKRKIEEPKKINNLLTQLRNEKHFTIVKRKIQEEKIRELEARLKEYDSDSILKKYRKATIDVLKEYKDIGPSRKVLTTDKNGKMVELPDPNTEKRLDIIRKFLQIAKIYYPALEIYQEVRNKFNCVGCDRNLSALTPDDTGTIICPDCGIEKISYDSTMNAEDSEFMESKKITRNEYDDGKNFNEEFLSFQGLQNTNISEVLYKKLDDYFLSFGKLKGSDIREGKSKPGFICNRATLQEALSEIGYKEYKNINLIGHRYWGWHLPDLSVYHDEIFEIYRRTQEAFHRITDKERKSSIDTRYRLFKLLQLVGYACRKEDFKMPSDDTVRKLDVIWEQMCELSGVRYIPTV